MLLRPSRRAMMIGLAACGFALTVGGGRALAATPPIELTWDDLAPNAGGPSINTLKDLAPIFHGQLDDTGEGAQSAPVTNAYDGKTVRIAGFVAPLEYNAEGIRTFILVPYVGACIHVPPPPANQLVLVTTETPYQGDGIFEAVYVTGEFSAAAVDTELAEIGYTLKAQQIDPYEQ